MSDDYQPDKRQHKRKEALADARIEINGSWHDCRIINISEGGAKISIECQSHQGDAVQLHIGSFGNFRCVVAWCAKQELGVRFNHDPMEMGNLVMGLALYG
jgi:hypothetical protein